MREIAISIFLAAALIATAIYARGPTVQRYEMHNAFRLDTQTGEVTYCRFQENQTVRQCRQLMPPGGRETENDYVVAEIDDEMSNIPGELGE